MSCKKQNVHSQTWIKLLRFLRVFMYFGNKFSEKETLQNILLILKTESFQKSLSKSSISNLWRQFVFAQMTKYLMFHLCSILEVPISETGYAKRRHCVKSVQIRRDTKYLSLFSPNAGKYGPEKTPRLDTFHAVRSIAILKKW